MDETPVAAADAPPLLNEETMRLATRTTPLVQPPLPLAAVDEESFDCMDRLLDDALLLLLVWLVWLMNAGIDVVCRWL